MVEFIKGTLLVVSALFPIVNPLGTSPIFLLLTSQYSTVDRLALARRIALNSFILLVISYLIGTHILAFFGISLPVVQIGGGLLVVSTGWTMLNRKDDDDSKVVQREVRSDDAFLKAFYPLTLPLTVGPGAISVAITLGANTPILTRLGSIRIDILTILGAVLGSLVIAFTVYLSFGFADRLARMLGATAMSVILRLSSFLLVCIGVQIVWNGARALLLTLPLH